MSAMTPENYFKDQPTTLPATNSAQSWRSSKFIFASSLLHLFGAIAIAAVALNVANEKKSITEIEVIETPKPIPAAVIPSPMPPIGAAEKVVPETKIKEQALVAAPTSKPVKPKRTTPKPMKVAAPLPAKQVEAQEVLPEEIHETISESPVIVPVPVFDDKMVEEDLEKVSSEEKMKSDKELAAAKEEADRKSSALAQEAEAKLAAIEASRLADESRMAKEKERADALVAAKKLAKEKSDADAAAMAAMANAGGNNGEGVRQVEDLRQLAGNQKPAYDEDDRFNKREGLVVFQAYVTREGGLRNFQIIQSSGYRSLDLKAYKALRTWKFYPGQEGPVEMPFVWNLKGGPQERATGLRKKVGLNP